jgi:protein SCO1/2
MGKFLRFVVLAVIGFMLGAGAAYFSNHRNAPQPVITGGKPTPAFDVVGKNGRLAIVKPGTGNGTEDPSAGGDDIAATAAAKAEADAKPHAATELEQTQLTQAAEGVSPQLLQKQAFLRAHSQPSIGMHVDGTFELTDTDGKTVTEKSFPGKFLLIYFGFSKCPDICPVTLEKMGKVIEKLGDLGDSVQPIFITVDPKRDTQEVLKVYAEKLPPEFVLLTGSEEQVKKAEEAFKVQVDMLPGTSGSDDDYVVNHSALVYFMSPRNKLEEIIRLEQSTDKAFGKMQPYLLGTAQKTPATP